MSDSDDSDDVASDGPSSQRVDRWLWFARIVKSRTLAAGLIGDGRVRVNSARVEKASQLVKPGDVLTLTVGARLRILKVQAIGKRRGPSVEAQELYEDLTPPPPPRENAPIVTTPGEREAGAGRPTKRDRRQIEKLKGEG